MDSRDHSTVSSSTHPGNHESHEVHLCHRCGWPFPNPHPSAKHRRAHNRVCGTIEGYSVIHSQEDSHPFSVSDDEHEHEHASDSDDAHTPSPKPVEKSDKEFPSSSVTGEKTKKSEEDEFSDAVTEFGDGGVSSQMERFYSFTGDSKHVKQERVENAVYSNSSEKVEDTSDTTEPFSDPTRSGAVLPLKAPDQSIGVAPTTDKKAEAVSFATNDGLQAGVVESGILEVVVNSIPENTCQDAAIEEKECKLPSVTSVSEKATVPSPRLISVERNESCSHPVSEVVNHDLSLQTEHLRNGVASSEVENVAYAAETGSSAKIIGEIPLPEETNQSDALVVEKTEEIGSIADDKFPTEGSLLSVKPGGSTQPSDSREGDLAVSEAICLPIGSVATNSQEHITTTVEDHQNKADLSEPPSFIASALCEIEGEHHKSSPASETVEVASDQPPKSDVKSFIASSHCEIEGEHHKASPASETVEVASDLPPKSDAKSFIASCEIEGEHHKAPPASETVEVASDQPPKSDAKSFIASALCEIEGEHHKAPPASQTIEVASDQPPKSDVKSFIAASAHSEIEGEHDKVALATASETVEVGSDQPPKSDVKSLKASDHCGMEGEHHKVAPAEVASYEPPKSDVKSSIASGDCGMEGEHDKVAPKSDGSQAGTGTGTLASESEGKQKNEEVIGSSPVKHHSPLKNLLDEVKSPNTNQQVPCESEKDAGFVKADIEEWNSPARYPIEIKKEKKKKGKSYWVPFVCCSSVHRDL